TEINDILISSLGLAIREVLGVEKSVLKMEGHGREDIINGVDISRTVGWFTSIYPFILDVEGVENLSQGLVQVKEALRKVPNKGIGYGILRYLTDCPIIERKASIVFNYLGDFGSEVGGVEQNLFMYSPEYKGVDMSFENSSDELLDVSGMLVSGQLRMSLRYCSLNYHSDTIQRLADSYKSHLTRLITDLGTTQARYLTPSDLSYKGLSIESVCVLNSENNLEDVYKLSPLQQGIYYHWLSDRSSFSYFEQLSYRLKGSELVIENLKGAYDLFVARHGILRTSFTIDLSDCPLQIVRKTVPSNFSYESLPIGLDRREQEAYIEKKKDQDKVDGFDLSGFSQIRLKVLELEPGEYEFIWSHHHILLDGWCTSILINDFNKILRSIQQNKAVDLPIPQPYSRYIQWLERVDTEVSMNYWKEYLFDYSTRTSIPFEIKSSDTSYVHNSLCLEVSGDLYRNVRDLCVELGFTQNIFLQGVWGYLLSRYNNTTDVVFGSVVSGRPGELFGVEEMIGLFINTIPVRVRYGGDDTVKDLLLSLQQAFMDGGSHHYLSSSDIQSQSELRNGLIDHIMVFENYAIQDGVEKERDEL